MLLLRSYTRQRSHYFAAVGDGKRVLQICQLCVHLIFAAAFSLQRAAHNLLRLSECNATENALKRIKMTENCIFFCCSLMKWSFQGGVPWTHSRTSGCSACCKYHTEKTRLKCVMPILLRHRGKIMLQRKCSVHENCCQPSRNAKNLLFESRRWLSEKAKLGIVDAQNAK
jgi:hypothetical protein